MVMESPSNNAQGSPAPPRRSRTRRDPSDDQVYRVPPQDFAHTVQRLTGAAAASPAATRPPSPPQPPALSVSTPATRSMQEAYLAGPAAASPAATRPSPPQPPALSTVSTPATRSMQEAYLAWCASNNVPLSPGTMAEMAQFRD